MSEFFSHATAFFTNAIDIFLHLDVHLTAWANVFGGWLYAILFLVIFCETGLVVTPFLPGDSLLFATGALAALPGSPLQIGWVIILLAIAGILGDSVNYAIGKKIGPKVFRSNSRWLNQRHLQRTHEFYEKHGGKTIIFARFMPIIRTFAPFVAGIGYMSYRRFLAFNVIGAIAWVTMFSTAGYFFGSIPHVKSNFQYVILAIIIISLIPIFVEFIRARRQARRAAMTPADDSVA
ncbi:MAG: DedA family protein [Deltaproteobacteria bacterium]|nr:DedA family protein [Deltaproteobacteria bacterium]